MLSQVPYNKHGRDARVTQAQFLLLADPMLGREFLQHARLTLDVKGGDVQISVPGIFASQPLNQRLRATRRAPRAGRLNG